MKVVPQTPKVPVPKCETDRVNREEVDRVLADMELLYLLCNPTATVGECHRLSGLDEKNRVGLGMQQP